MFKVSLIVLVLGTFLFGASAAVLAQDPLPVSFDLRNYNGENYVTSVKSQSGGTCWTHGAMASMESNLLMTGTWETVGESGEPNMAEYHLDWWNGFNQNNNDDTDPPTGGGLIVHEGGDYRVTSAYLSRGEGAVRDIDGQSFATPPARSDTGWHYYYVPDIEWYVMDDTLGGIDSIKSKIMTEGAIGICLCSDAAFISGYVHYQPPTDITDPNHAVTVVGWNDNQYTLAPQPGAWLVKNSWGEGWGYDGYFWISYYDKHACRHPEMGAISFQDVEPMSYDKFYYHDYHGWRDTKTDCSEAFNAFTGVGYEYGAEILEAVNFFTAEDNVAYTVKIYDEFAGGTLQTELAVMTGSIEHTGFHTVKLDAPIELTSGKDFYVYLELSSGGHPFDRTSDVPVLLGAKYRTIVESDANPGESYYYDGAEWQDFYDLESTGNFCIKALSSFVPYLEIGFPDGIPEIMAPMVPAQFTVEITDAGENYVPGSAMLNYRFDGGVFMTSPLQAIFGDLYQAEITPTKCDDIPEFYISAEGVNRTSVVSPYDAPIDFYSAVVGEISVLMEDDFETDQGWVAENLGATNGYWQRGVPVDDAGWDYDPATDGDGSGQCYLTENVSGNTDVDGGAVRLTSSTFDMTGGGGIEYDYYLYLTGTDVGIDKLLVEINSDNGVGNWTIIANHINDNGLNWKHHEITETELITAGVSFTSTMKVRFTANDSDPQSIVEAGIDGFTVSTIICEIPFICGDNNDDGIVNILDIVYLISHLYQGGPEPVHPEAADVDNNGAINLLDITYLISYLYMGGSDPACE